MSMFFKLLSVNITMLRLPGKNSGSKMKPDKSPELSSFEEIAIEFCVDS